MTLKVHKDRIFVILEPMKKTVMMDGPGGTKIEVPISEKHSERSRIGVVQKCGENVNLYKPGDRVLLSVYAGVRIHLIDEEIDGRKVDEDLFRIIREEEIVAVLED